MRDEMDARIWLAGREAFAREVDALLGRLAARLAARRRTALKLRRPALG